VCQTYKLKDSPIISNPGEKVRRRKGIGLGLEVTEQREATF